MRFFFDNHLAPKLARGLHEFVRPDHEVVHLKDMFPGGTEDENWMRGLVGEANWVIVTADINIGKNPHEIRAWQEVGHIIVFLKSGWINFSFWTQAYKFTKCFPAIIDRVLEARAGDSFVVTVNGKMED